MSHLIKLPLAGLALTLLAACGGAAAPSPSPSIASATGSSPAAASAPAAKPATSASPSAKPAPTQVKVLFGTLAGAHAFVRLAADKGLFQKYGLVGDVSYGESTTGVAALLAGQVQFDLTGGVEIIEAVAAGAPLKILALNQDTNPYALFSLPNIKTVNDLKGKTVAVGKKSDTSDVSLRMAIKGSGLEPDKDFSLREIGNSPARLAALTSKQIDAGVMDADAYSQQAKAQGLNMLVSLAEKNIPYAAGALAVNASFARDNPQAVTGTLQALIEGGRLFGDPNSKTDALAIMAQDFKTTPDDPVVTRAYDIYSARYRDGAAIVYPHADAIDTIVEALKTIDASRYGSLNSNAVIDTSFMDGLRSSGFLRPAEARQA
ncbi:MAG TPA: ABC transporter substrate-binding protein [Chloroflexota bacterium]|nr:ABC transporter substrate-binding protein [Chloroflexota bacterium]